MSAPEWQLILALIAVMVTAPVVIQHSASEGRDVIPETPQLPRTREGMTTSGQFNLRLRINGHHVLHWGDGGITEVPNLVLLSHRHHASVHEGRWQLVTAEIEGSSRSRRRTATGRGPERPLRS
jgi:hypothetical protein